MLLVCGSTAVVTVVVAHRGPGASLNCTGTRPTRVVLAERVTLPVVGHEDPGHVGMALEGDAEHVVDLALHVLGARV